MTDLEGHRCSKDKTGVILHRFKLKLKERMQSNLDENWSSERTRLLDSVKDQPELTTQLLLEMKDSRSFRVNAQRARGKMTPPIPKDHQMMDPEKVFFIFLLSSFGKWSKKVYSLHHWPFRNPFK